MKLSRLPILKYWPKLPSTGSDAEADVERELEGAEPELKMLPALRSDGCFIDIGANVGQWSRIAAKIFPHVHAFEPDRDLAELLRRSMPPTVTVYPVAVSNREGTGQLAIPLVGDSELKSRASLEQGANVGFSEISRTVDLVRLDEYQFKNIAVIKIDVEGHEGRVIDGARETIVRERPILIVEIEERHHPNQSSAIFDRLLPLGYFCYYIDDRRIQAFKHALLEKLQPAGVVPPIGIKPTGYVNNFIFLPTEKKYLVHRIAEFLNLTDMTKFWSRARTALQSLNSGTS